MFTNQIHQNINQTLHTFCTFSRLKLYSIFVLCTGYRIEFPRKVFNCQSIYSKSLSRIKNGPMKYQFNAFSTKTNKINTDNANVKKRY